MPTPSWTVSFTMPTASNSPAKACAGHEANRTRRLDQPPSPVTQIHRPARLATRAASFVTVGDIIQESRATSSHYTRATSSESAGKDFLPAIALEEPVVGQGPWAFCKWRDDGIVPLICPTCQIVFAGIAQSIRASDHRATLHGVVFDILVGSERLVLAELVMNRRSEPQNTRLVGLRRSLASILACLSARTRRRRLSVSGRQ